MKSIGAGVPVQIPVRDLKLPGILSIPDGATALVIFAHGSGSSRLSPRNLFVSRALQQAGLATLLFDLLTQQEEEVDQITGHLRFDIQLLANRLVSATDWANRQEQTSKMSKGYFGASTGGGAAMVAAAARPADVQAVVSRGGRPDLAGRALSEVEAPTLLIVGGNDPQVIHINRVALSKMSATVSELHIVPGAGHLFEEPGALEQVAELARDWFLECLP